MAQDFLERPHKSQRYGFGFDAFDSQTEGLDSVMD